jgi:MoaA/NifB/PqqE/SkfB family radical SAM enzyme
MMNSSNTLIHGIREDWKAAARTARNLVLRNRPYFGHFYVTQRCNLKCDYCQAWEKIDMPELGLADTKRLIDVLDKMGIAVLSLTGGEPLMRKDLFEVIDYAKAKGLFTKITSNGTMPHRLYEKLLHSRINAIAISLDGVGGDDLPFSKEGPKILETIDYLFRNKGDKALSLSTLLFERNREKIEGLVQYVKGRWPGLGIFVQPVVVGTGDFRRSTQQKVDPRFLRGLGTLEPDFFIDACVKYYEQDRFNWGCQAGTLFFDIKPNGDFWICQDIGTNLNFLDEDFLEKWKKLDYKSLIAPCQGCVYSCYYLVQQSFQLRNLPQMVGTYLKSYHRES